MSHLLSVSEHPHLGEIVIPTEKLNRRVNELGEEITRDYEGTSPLLVSVLKGAVMFTADLARAIRLPVEFDFMAVASYGTATKTSGVVRIIKDLDTDLTGRHVIIVEDIVDSGLTLRYLSMNLLARDPASLKVCSLIVKEGIQRTKVRLDYVGFRTAPDFLVGYGLDAGEKYRNLPYLCKYTGRDHGSMFTEQDRSGEKAESSLQHSAVGDRQAQDSGG